MRMINIGAVMSNLLGTSSADLQMMRAVSSTRQIGPGDSTVMSLHRDVEKSRRQAAARKAIGRWHPMHEIKRKRA